MLKLIVRLTNNYIVRTSPKIRTQIQLYNNWKQIKSKDIKYQIVGFSLLGFLGGNEPKEIDPEDEIIMVMKRAILCIQRNETNKAEQMLHIALTMAQKQNNQNAITYIYDLMANLAMERGELMKAKNLFVNVMQRLFTNGISEDDMKIIHMSLKVANIHKQMGYLNECEIGYKWCLDKLKLHNHTDAQILTGIVLDYYAQLNVENGHLMDAIKQMEQAIQICKQEYGDQHEQTIKLLNDLASIHWRANNLIDAEKLYRQCLILIEQSELDEIQFYIGVIKSNLGILLTKREQFDEAEMFCKDAWHFAKKFNLNDVLNQANYCLDELSKNKHA